MWVLHVLSDGDDDALTDLETVDEIVTVAHPETDALPDGDTDDDTVCDCVMELYSIAAGETEDDADTLALVDGDDVVDSVPDSDAVCVPPLPARKNARPAASVTLPTT